MSGVQKENFEVEVIDGPSSDGGGGGGSGGSDVTGTKDTTTADNGSNNHDHNANNAMKNTTSSSSSGSSNATENAENGTKNTNKKTKFDSIQSTSDTSYENTPKKRKLCDDISTHILYHTERTEEVSTDLDKLKNTILNNTDVPLSSVVLCNGVVEKNNSVKNDKEENSFCYNPKYFDNETHVRLSAMYARCEGVPLDSLVLSEEMLMLMGYPGCDWEEGYSFFCVLSMFFTIFCRHFTRFQNYF